MGLSRREQAQWWGLGLSIFLLFVWAVGQALLPFVAGAALAYLLDPLADRLERRGLSRTLATLTITLAMLLAVIGILLLLIPALIRQAQALFDTAPAILARFQTFLAHEFPDLLRDGSPLRLALDGAGEQVRAQGIALLNGLLSSSLAVVDFLVLVVVAPVVAFYLLLDWDHMMAHADELLPREHAGSIRGILREVDRVLAGFVRGQLLVCAILGSFYAIALAAIGLPFGLVIGVFAGLISFIPFIGSILGGALSIGIALFQFWGDWGLVGAVAGVFVLGQAVEGNVLTPRLVGSSVGLHPVWLMFALSAFGALFGFTGLLIAVPAAAAIGVLGRFLLAQYRLGRLYTGPSSQVLRPDKPE